MVKYLCIIQARMNSSRLPAKSMLDLAGKTLVHRVYESVEKSNLIDEIVVATSLEKSDDVIALKLEELGYECYRGDLNNVLSRFYETAVQYNAANIVRVTADNPLSDGKVIDTLIKRFEEKDVDFCSYVNCFYGLTAEVFSFKALKEAHENAKTDFEKEHVTPYIKDNLNSLSEDIELKFRRPDCRITIDTLEDYIKMQKFYLYCRRNSLTADIENFILHEDKFEEIF